MKKLLPILLLSAASLSGKAQVVPGGDMETWKSYTSAFTTMYRPQYWSSSDSLVRYVKALSSPGTPYTARVTQSTDKHGGASAAQLVSNADGYPTVIGNGDIKVNFTTFEYTFSGGATISDRIHFVKAWVKYDYATVDTGVMYLFASIAGAGAGGADSVVGQGQLYIHKNTSYNEIVGYINYINPTVVPNRLVVAFAASKTTLGGPDGTTLHVDDVTYADPTGIERPLNNDPAVHVYPNPVLNTLYLDAGQDGARVAKVYNQLGQLMSTVTFERNMELNTAAFSSGTYVVILEEASTQRAVYSTQFVKQ